MQGHTQTCVFEEIENDAVWGVGSGHIGRVSICRMRRDAYVEEVSQLNNLGPR